MDRSPPCYNCQTESNSKNYQIKYKIKQIIIQVKDEISEMINHKQEFKGERK